VNKHTIVNLTLLFALGMPIKLLSTSWSNTTHMLLQSRYPLAAEATTTFIRTYPQIQYQRKFIWHYSILHSESRKLFRYILSVNSLDGV